MRKWLPLVIVVASVVFSVAVYDRLPERMAIHWGVSGEPDGFGSRLIGAFSLPAVMLVLWGILAGLPKLDPRRANIEKFRDSYDIIVVAIVASMAVLHVAMVGFALGWPIEVGRLAPISIGALFLILGNLLPRFRSNFFFGIRTPWTLSSDKVWTRTHRVGGYMMVAIGLLLIAAGIVGTAVWLYVAIAGSLLLTVGLLGFSYWAWRNEKRAG